MGTFSQFIESKKITAPQIVRVSARLEASTIEGRKLSTGRATKRRNEAAKSYADANLAKPPAGRGVGLHQVNAAVADKELPRKVRAKLVRAVTALVAKSGGTVDTKTLFGETVAKKGKKVEKAAAA